MPSLSCMALLMSHPTSTNILVFSLDVRLLMYHERASRITPHRSRRNDPNTVHSNRLKIIRPGKKRKIHEEPHSKHISRTVPSEPVNSNQPELDEGVGDGLGDGVASIEKDWADEDDANDEAAAEEDGDSEAELDETAAVDDD
ncbi:hypothetical protein EK21DRAFT_110278 [Setomelanomma holmii]|uniref:Uncharacterized protein n=1 Tax=Setomelanomma holmii TaxID=210430 RepID=A0A9P4HCE2_9PLEO|nr:hypothetical protein EK21DRAFT_110278 [Setomelanomma holmii]